MHQTHRRYNDLFGTSYYKRRLITNSLFCFRVSNILLPAVLSMLHCTNILLYLYSGALIQGNINSTARLRYIPVYVWLHPASLGTPLVYFAWFRYYNSAFCFRCESHTDVYKNTHIQTCIDRERQTHRLTHTHTHTHKHRVAFRFILLRVINTTVFLASIILWFIIIHYLL